MERRSFLGGLLGGAAFLTPLRALGRERKQAPADALGLLLDSRRCVGCKACQSACRKANKDLPDPAGQGLYHAPVKLTDNARTVIYKCEEGGHTAFLKKQCMHCLDPACASVCMLGALAKREYGLVTYDKDLCIGCRYCQIACPFDVPRFEWDDATPLIVKCELCRDRIAEGGQPACAEVCPRQAIVYGKRDTLLLEARRRIYDHPGEYQNHIYGEHEGGGTQVLVLSSADMPFAALGLPALGSKGVPALSETVQHGIYKGFIAPLALYGVLGAVLLRNRKRAAQEVDHE